MKQEEDPSAILQKAGISVPEEARQEIHDAMLKLKLLAAKLAAWK